MTRSGGVVGLVGGLGAGWTFAASLPLALGFLGLSVVTRVDRPLRALDFVPVLLIAAAALTAMFAGRFGWVVTGVAAVVEYGLAQIDLRDRTEVSLTAAYGAFSVTQGIVLGGALAAFAAAGRGGRRAIAAGLAAGSVAGAYLGFALATAYAQGHLGPQAARVLNDAVLALCVAAGLGSLILLIRRREATAVATPPDWVPLVVSVVVATAAIMGVVLTAASPSQALYVAAAAAIVIALVGAWRAGAAGASVVASWALVGFAAGSATALYELMWRARVEAWPLAAAGAGGVLLGTLLARSVGRVPWEAVALVGVAAALLASRPPSLLEFMEGAHRYRPGPITAVALTGLAVAAALSRLADRVPDLRSGAAAGFASFVVAGVLAAPISGFVFKSPVWDRRAIAIGVAGLAVLALHLGFRSRSRSAGGG